LVGTVFSERRIYPFITDVAESNVMIMLDMSVLDASWSSIIIVFAAINDELLRFKNPTPGSVLSVFSKNL
jgi:hypothetical protein